MYWIIYLIMVCLLLHLKRRIDWVFKTRIGWIDADVDKYRKAVSFNRMVLHLSWSEKVEDWQRGR